MIRRPPRSTPFPTRRSSDLAYIVEAPVFTDGRSATIQALQLDGYVTPATQNVSLTIPQQTLDRKSTRLNSSHSQISYAVFCLKKKKSSKSALPTVVRARSAS